jgi:hypothetical protein
MLFTMLQSQKRCRMVSLVSPQKAHNSVSTSLHLYKNVFVGMVLWRSLYILKHFQCIIKSTVIWQNVNKFPIYFFNIQQIFLFIFRIYRSFSIFSQKYVIKRFTWLNTISNFIKLFHVGPGHRQKPCTIILNEVLPKSREKT